MSSATNTDRARPDARPIRYSVVIVSYNARENVRACLESLALCSGEGDHEVIVVDNDSKDGTAEYLAGLDWIRPVLNKENNGFSKGCNQGAALARGEFVVFLNPDTLVTRGWTDTMAAYFQDPTVGAVGPTSNYVAGRQKVELYLPEGWQQGVVLAGRPAQAVAEDLASLLRMERRGNGVMTKLLIGFCLMMKRELYASLGGMDEKLFLGNDDLDLSWRLREMGLKLVVASDAFVFHEGQKSFQTEKKSKVELLVQESTDALYRKLVDYYGGRDKVPTPLELWDMAWFKPSPELLQGGDASRAPAEASMIGNTQTQAQTQAHGAWKDVAVLVYLGPEARGTALERTLATLPRPLPEVLILNCSGANPSADGFRKLDLGPRCAPGKALEVALSLVSGSHALFCAAGVEFSALFNHWLDKRDRASLPQAAALPLRLEGASEAPEREAAGAASLCRVAWLREACKPLPDGEAAFFAGLAAELARTGKADSPWLLARSDELPLLAPAARPVAAAAPESWTPVAAPAGAKPAAPEAYELFPESLRDAMRDARSIVFAGAAAETPPKDGAFRGYDVKGEMVSLEGRDLVVLRVTPDLLDGLEERLRNLRLQAPSLERLILVCDGNRARREPMAPGQFVPNADLTSEALRACLGRAGFRVVEEKPYRFKGTTHKHGEQGLDTAGWLQIEAAPRAASHASEKLVSIIMLGFNQVEYTRKAIESIRAHTRQKYELILIDNGSHDGTEAFFRSVPGAKVIRNAENLGVSKGWNQGLRIAQGDYLLILNNDIIVGPGWLENMVRLAESDASIGMVGPRSNYIAGPQVVPQVPYKSIPEIQPFIADWHKRHDLGAEEWGFIKGFALLIPRRVYAQVGFFDERFGKGNFEDDDYCMRVRYHGHKLMMAHDSFIHHFGSVSFNQESVDWKALMRENQGKYEAKWAKGAAAIHDTQVDDPAAPARAAAPGAGPLPAGPLHEAQAAYERGDLAAARRLFLDAQARNPGDPDAYCGLGAVLFHDGAHKDAVALFLRCLEIDPGHADAARNLLDCLSSRGAFSEAERAALAHRFPANAVFSGPASAAAPAAAAAEPKAAWRAEIETAIAARDYTAAMAFLEARLRSGADNGACFNYFGIIAHHCGDRKLALEHFQRAVKLGPADADMVFNLADTYVALGRAGEALALLENPPAMDKRQAEEAELSAMREQIRHALEQGDLDGMRIIETRERNLEGERHLRATLEGGSDEAVTARAIFTAILEQNPGDFRALNNLGLAEWYLGGLEAAWERFRACLAIRPAWPDALVNAFDAALALGCPEAILPLLDKAQAVDPMGFESGRMRHHLDREGSAIGAAKSFEALEEDARLLEKAEQELASGRKSEAIFAYLAALERRQDNPQALNGLGIIAFREKRFADAYGLFDSAAALHPLDQDILLNLWQGAQALSREREALPRLRQSLERDPSMADIKTIVKEYA